MVEKSTTKLNLFANSVCLVDTKNAKTNGPYKLETEKSKNLSSDTLLIQLERDLIAIEKFDRLLKTLGR